MRLRGDGKVFVLSSYFLGRCAHSWEVRCQKKQEQACYRQVPFPTTHADLCDERWLYRTPGTPLFLLNLENPCNPPQLLPSVQ